MPPGPDPGRRPAALGGGARARGGCSLRGRFIAAGPCEDTAAAMEQAGAAFSWLDRREIAAGIPFAAAPWKAGVLDPLGGSLRLRRARSARITHSDGGDRRQQYIFFQGIPP